jgi:hypothetical protein
MTGEEKITPLTLNLVPHVAVPSYPRDTSPTFLKL